MDALFFNVLARDAVLRLKTERSKVWLCIVFAVIGTVLGVVAYSVSQYTWWGGNRCDYAYKLMYGGFFAVLLSYALCGAGISFALCCFAKWNVRWLNLLLVFVVSLYFGANCCAVCYYSGLLGVLYAVFLLLSEEIINLFCCFFAFSERCCGSTFLQAFRDVKVPIFLQIGGILVKMFVIFALLRTLTALI